MDTWAQTIFTKLADVNQLQINAVKLHQKVDKGWSPSFTKVTLSQDEFISFAILFSAAMVAWFFVLFTVLPRDVKKTAWVISLLNSLVTFPLGGLYTYMKAPAMYAALFNGGDGSAVLLTQDDMSVLLSLWFGLACVWDILIGLVFYRSQIGFLTGWVHHTVYVWMMIGCTTGYGIFVTSVVYSPNFVLVLVEELPTFLLALGSIFPSLRTDLGFGVTFFALRLVYHVFMFYFTIRFYSLTRIPTVMFTLTLAMHLQWFSGWVKMYFFPKKKEKKM